MEDEIYSVKEVAKFLRVHELTVYALIHRAALPSRRLGGKHLISGKALAKWLENGGEISKVSCLRRSRFGDDTCKGRKN